MRYEEFWGRPGLAPKQHRAEKITSAWNAKRVTWQESGRRPPPGVDLSSAFTVSDVIRHASKIGLAAWEGDESELRECCGAFIDSVKTILALKAMKLLRRIAGESVPDPDFR